MTVQECVEYVNEVKPNAFEEDRIVLWLGQLEGRIAAEIFLMAPCELQRFHFTSMEEDGDKILLVDPPHDEIYLAYLTAKVDSRNGEYNKQANAAQAFQRCWNEFSAYIANLYNPARGYPEPEGYRQSTSWEEDEEYGIVG